MLITQRILDFILPSSCSFCRSPVGGSKIAFFCSDCWNDFSAFSSPVCPSCGRPFDSPETLQFSPEHVCRDCRQNPPQFDQALAVGQFEGPLREAIHQFKYRPCRSLGRPLGDWMVDRIRLLADTDLIMPIPLHITRLRLRGFNQALLLAHRLSLRFAVPLSYDNLARVRPTVPQVELRGNERIKNVKGAFALRRPDEVRGKKIILIDDVFTTGATMNECASVLKRAEVSQVTACTLARAI